MSSWFQNKTKKILSYYGVCTCDIRNTFDTHLDVDADRLRVGEARVLERVGGSQVLRLSGERDAVTLEVKRVPTIAEELPRERV